MASGMISLTVRKCDDQCWELLWCLFKHHRCLEQRNPTKSRRVRSMHEMQASKLLKLLSHGQSNARLPHVGNLQWAMPRAPSRSCS